MQFLRKKLLEIASIATVRVWKIMSFQIELSISWSFAEKQQLRKRIFRHIDSNAGSSPPILLVAATSAGGHKFVPVGQTSS